jgi:hypothetical protein
MRYLKILCCLVLSLRRRFQQRVNPSGEGTCPRASERLPSTTARVQNISLQVEDSSPSKTAGHHRGDGSFLARLSSTSGVRCVSRHDWRSPACHLAAYTVYCSGMHIHLTWFVFPAGRGCCPIFCIAAVLFTVRRESCSARWCVCMLVLSVLEYDRAVNVGDRCCCCSEEEG